MVDLILNVRSALSVLAVGAYSFGTITCYHRCYVGEPFPIKRFRKSETQPNTVHNSMR